MLICVDISSMCAPALGLHEGLHVPDDLSVPAGNARPHQLKLLQGILQMQNKICRFPAVPRSDHLLEHGQLQPQRLVVSAHQNVAEVGGHAGEAAVTVHALAGDARVEDEGQVVTLASDHTDCRLYLTSSSQHYTVYRPPGRG